MPSPLSALRRLESLKFEFGPASAEKKRECLRDLKAGKLKSADQVLRLHEALCFLQAFPDSTEILQHVESLLDRFERRRDLREFAEKLTDSGIAGTPTRFTFYAAMAGWLVDHWPGQLQIDWAGFENIDRFEPYLTLLASYSETPALDSLALEVPEWIEQLKAPHETDADFVIRRLRQLVANNFLHERFYEEFNIPLVLSAGVDTPNRTRTKYDRSPVLFQTAPFVRGRPALAEERQQPPGPLQPVDRYESERLIDLAHTAMATRARDLDAFAYADVNDVQLVDDTCGLQFVLYGLLPERRFLLETQYGYLILKNGVPISYGAITCLFHSSEVAYTIFDTFRGGESARIYARTLVMVSHLFGCDTFMIDPYQLGEDNDDALQSGAWWFYQKLGYRPRDKKLLRLMEQELSKMRRRPSHRSPISVLKELSTDNVYLSLEESRDDVLGILDFPLLGMKITRLLADRFGADREEGLDVLAAEAAQRLDVPGRDAWTDGERLAWNRWSPLVALLPQLDRWPAADQQALVKLIRAKGGRSELNYLRQFDAHARLRKAVQQLASVT